MVRPWEAFGSSTRPRPPARARTRRARSRRRARVRDLGDWLAVPRPERRRTVPDSRSSHRSWPTATAAFDRRLDEVITVRDDWPTAACPAAAARGRARGPGPAIDAAGFETIGPDSRMVLARHGDGDALVAAMTARVVPRLSARRAARDRRSRRESPPCEWPVALDGTSRECAARSRGLPTGAAGRWMRRWSSRTHSASTPSGGAPSRTTSWRASRGPAAAVLSSTVDGVPAAIARRATTKARQLSLRSIGTRPAFRSRGLGALATALVVRDALAAGSAVIHLAVEDENERALRLYERLGFARRRGRPGSAPQRELAGARRGCGAPPFHGGRRRLSARGPSARRDRLGDRRA